MKPFRIIPTLLLERKRLVKTVNYRRPRYIGDPINAVRIFNEKEVDELVLIDIRAHSRGINFEHLRKIVSEAFMPVAYGGGIRTVADVRELLRLGVEKVVLGSAAAEDPDFVRAVSAQFGSQSIVASVDVKTTLWGNRSVVYRNATRRLREAPHTFAMKMAASGAGEILLNDVGREGTMRGFDVALIRLIAASVDIPVVAAGGAGSLPDIVDAWRSGGAHAVAAGSLFVYKGALRAVLINYPSEAAIRKALSPAC